MQRPNKSNLVKQKFTDIKTLSPIKDYSQYSININKENNRSTLVLNLSPFARIDKKYIDNIEQKREEFKEIAYQDDTNYLDNYTKYEELFKTNFSHVNAYAKQPNDMEKIKENEKAYLKKLHNIEDDYEKQLGDIPKKDRVFVASEQAFQYLTDRYDLKEGYIWAIDTDENGSPEQIKDLVKFIDKNEPSHLFVESNVDKRPMETVSKESGVSIYKKPIYSDEISKEGGVADTYLKYLEYNLDVLTDGLEK